LFNGGKHSGVPSANSQPQRRNVPNMIIGRGSSRFIFSTRSYSIDWRTRDQIRAAHFSAAALLLVNALPVRPRLMPEDLDFAVS